MLLTMGVGLYTSRVILNTLGISDYGIYNVVGGTVNILAFFNVGMMGASQRFISYELGKGDARRLGVTFSTAVVTHAILALIILVLGEAIGVFLLNEYLNIPENRLFAANCVLQFSILTFVLSTIIIPFNSCIISHEHMNVYAYVSVVEALLKLGVAISLIYSTIDNLILYSSMLMGVQISVSAVYFFYCKTHFCECSSFRSFDVSQFKKMFSFAGWGMVGNTGFTLKDQCSNILLNLFFGTGINAARGIATQVNGIINGFAANFSMAMNPQITKLYASGNVKESMELVYAGSRFTFYLLSIIVIPFLINSNYILTLWLGQVPEYTNVFVSIILLGSLIYSLSHTVSTAIQATGNVKWFQISLSTILLTEIPIAYIILRLGGLPYHALLPSLLTIPLTLLVRIVILKKYVPDYSIRVYFISCVFKCFFIFLVSISISYYIRTLIPDECFLTVVLSSLSSLAITGLIIGAVGLNSRERLFIMNKLKRASA